MILRLTRLIRPVRSENFHLPHRKFLHHQIRCKREWAVPCVAIAYRLHKLRHSLRTDKQQFMCTNLCNKAKRIGALYKLSHTHMERRLLADGKQEMPGKTSLTHDKQAITIHLISLGVVISNGN